MERFGDLQAVTVQLEEAATIITVARQKFLNALNKTVLNELNTVLEKLLRDFSDKPLIITGEGSRAFVAGADIGEMAEMTPKEAMEFSGLGQHIFSKIETFPAITIAAVNGYALGGGNELAMACDIRIASKNAKFGQPEVGLGIIPGFGGTQRLPRIVGMSHAVDLIASGRVINAGEALRIGLVNKVVDQGKALEESLSYVRVLLKNSSFALSQVKQAIAKSELLDKQNGMALEADLFGRCFSHPDQKEGMTAFLEKRRPEFKSLS